MFTINPFNSRSHNAKVTNWRILQLRGLVAVGNRLLPHRDAATLAEQVNKEISRVDDAYVSYVKAQFGENIAIEEGATCRKCKKGTLEVLPTKDCTCHISPPCDNCVSKPFTCNYCGHEAH